MSAPRPDSDRAAPRALPPLWIAVFAIVLVGLVLHFALGLGSAATFDILPAGTAA